ncbi:putative gliotoxin biosynthesis protein [Diplodia seriata]|uniref:Putative gliotoxin biosynthesis protein n=1 Tax=Diplodia seriata TaxID=420778 RepID=A0A0G2E4C9_9PEZI|nr:putative gliotoxin biosynthesis protein [Diplodia seriata]
MSAVTLGLSESTDSLFSRKRRSKTPPSLPPPSGERRKQSLCETPLDLQDTTPLDNVTAVARETVLYLAYGSNLCYETFQGKRGIRPLSQINVVVPSLRITFDLPGIPYTEPCFSNSGLRDSTLGNEDETASEKTPLLAPTSEYHKDRWKKGLVGVVYEVTLSDYAHIIATEGGGTGYKDVLVDCYPLDDEDSVPDQPTGQPFKAHTLFAPSDRGGRLKRPDPSYAQPSARYLKLITDGAEEHRLPKDYKDYLYEIRPYTITNVVILLGCSKYFTLQSASRLDDFKQSAMNSSAAFRAGLPWVQAPLIVGAPMRLIAFVPLAVEVSRAGGLGFIAAGSDTSILEPNLRKAHQQLTTNPIPRSDPHRVLPIGVGFINWGANLEQAAALLGEYTPAAAWFFAPRKTDDLGLWTSTIREATRGRTSIWVQVGTVVEALAVTHVCKPDVLVVQGTDAGGHGRERGAGIVALLPEVADAIAALNLSSRERPALMAAGGIAEGRGVAAALALGAEGVSGGHPRKRWWCQHGED